MKNPLTWEFAQKHFGRLWYKGAPWTAIFSSLAMLYSIGKTIAFIGFCGGCVIVIQLAVIIILGIITNSALKRNFTDEGNPQNRNDGVADQVPIINAAQFEKN